MNLNAFQKVMAGHEGPGSVCTCGHTGDTKAGQAVSGEHAGIQGHGRCMVDGCSCQQFKWKGFTVELQAKLDAAKGKPKMRGRGRVPRSLCTK